MQRDVAISSMLGLGYIGQAQRGLREGSELFFIQVAEIETIGESPNTAGVRSGFFFLWRRRFLIVLGLKEGPSAASRPIPLFRAPRHLVPPSLLDPGTLAKLLSMEVGGTIL